MITGSFKQRYAKGEFEFKISSLTLAENVKRQLTKQLQLEVDVRNVKSDIIGFLEGNLRQYPGKSGLRIIVSEPKKNLKVNLMTMDSGIEINNDLIQFLEGRPEIEVTVNIV
jgi:DNA polymerase-3 subunit alpha